MRKMMTKQVTTTTIKSATMDLKDGSPVAIPLEDEKVLGNYNLDRAQRYIDKIYDNAIVLEVVTDKLIYEMKVEDFIKQANVKEVL